MLNEQENTPSNTNPAMPESVQGGGLQDGSVTPDQPSPAGMGIPTEIEPPTSTLTSGPSAAPSPFATPSAVVGPTQAAPDASSAPALSNAFSSPSETTSAFPLSNDSAVPPKKSKRGFIVAGVIAAVLVLTVGASAAAYNLWYQNPDKVIGDALSNALVSETAKSDTKMTIKGGEGSNAWTVDATLNTLSDQKDARIDFAVASDAEGAKYDVSGSVIVKNNEKLFVKVDKLKEILEKSGMQAYLGSSESVTKLIDKLDSNWVVITKDEIEENTGSKDKASECIETAVKKLRTDKKYSDELADLYKKYPLVGVKEKLGSKDGSLGYEIEFKRANAIKFANGVNSTKFYSDIKKCDDKIEDLDGEEMFKEERDNDDGDAKVVVWIDRWSHQFTKLEVTGKSKESSGSLTTNIKFNVPVTIEEPSDPITVDELKSDMEAIQQELMQASESSAAVGPGMTSGSSFEI